MIPVFHVIPIRPNVYSIQGPFKSTDGPTLLHHRDGQSFLEALTTTVMLEMSDYMEPILYRPHGKKQTYVKLAPTVVEPVPTDSTEFSKITGSKVTDAQDIFLSQFRNMEHPDYDVLNPDKLSYEALWYYIYMHRSAVTLKQLRLRMLRAKYL